MLNKKQVAERLGVSPSTVDRLVRQGEIRCFVIYRRRKFRLEDVEQFLKEHEYKPPARAEEALFPSIRYVPGMKVV